ncbi:MAG: ATP-binding cassette domain-containing protein [Caldilineaceae bacterium]
MRDVSFQLEPGDALGIIGPNGAGKTTILKLLSRVSHPSSGALHVDGRLSALIELGAGFHPDLTGRENIYLNGTILRMRRRDQDPLRRDRRLCRHRPLPGHAGQALLVGHVCGWALPLSPRDPQVLLVDEVLPSVTTPSRMKCYVRMAGAAAQRDHVDLCLPQHGGRAPGLRAGAGHVPGAGHLPRVGGRGGGRLLRTPSADAFGRARTRLLPKRTHFPARHDL